MIAAQNRWQDGDKVADWLQVGSPAHLSWLEKSLQEPTLLIRKPLIKFKNVSGCEGKSANLWITSSHL